MQLWAIACVDPVEAEERSRQLDVQVRRRGERGADGNEGGRGSESQNRRGEAVVSVLELGEATTRWLLKQVEV